MLFFLLIETAAHTRLAEKREQHTVTVVVAAAHTRLAEKREQHTVAVLAAAAAVAVARQTPPPQVSSSRVNIPINAPRGKRGNVSRDHTTTSEH